MDAQVDDEPLFDGKRFSTDLTAKRLEPRVAGQMGLEGAHLGEGLLADVTFEPGTRIN